MALRVRKDLQGQQDTTLQVQQTLGLVSLPQSDKFALDPQAMASPAPMGHREAVEDKVPQVEIALGLKLEYNRILHS
jgi:hypothetical protein